MDGGQSYDSRTATRLRQLVAERGVRYHRVAAGDSLAGLGGVGGLVLHPNADYVDSSGASAYGRRTCSTRAIQAWTTSMGASVAFSAQMTGATSIYLNSSWPWPASRP